VYLEQANQYKEKDVQKRVFRTRKKMDTKLRCPLTLSVLGHMAAIVLRLFSGNFTRSEIHAVKNSEEVLSYFFHLHKHK
jgi:hypothetical protein